MAMCKTCKGKKKVIISADKSPLKIAMEVTCSECKGMGETDVPGACPCCNGSKKTIVMSGKFGIEVACPFCSKLEKIDVAMGV